MPSTFTTDFRRIPLDAFRELPAALLTEAFFRVHELTNAYVDARSRDVLAAFQGRSRPAPDRLFAREWLERRVRRASAWTLDAAEVREIALAEDAALAPALEAIDAAAAAYPAFLRGEVDGAAVLFDPKRPDLWERYFSNENPIYGAGNALAAHAAALSLGDRLEGRALRVLEVGAGCGSAAQALLDRLGGAIDHYVLTDISPGFLRKARERLDAHAAASGLRIEYRLLDLNRPSPAWPAPQGAWDVVYAVNVLHSARDLVETLRGLRGLLAPGGRLVLGECVRPRRGHPVHPEFVFQLLPELRAMALDPELRPEPGFLDAASWRTCLAAAGFERVRLLPEFAAAVAAYPEHSLGAVIASA